MSVRLIEREDGLAAIAEACSRAEAIALDVEADGLYAYRQKLCTAQLAWTEPDGTLAIAVIDTLAVSIKAFRDVFAASGPVKVLHDLSFDAKMLGEAGAPIANVRDTSVAARLLGFKATGLAALVQSELGFTLDKHFQQHDWSKRPIGAAELTYLSGDVRHLLALDAHLATLAKAKGIEAEIADECAYKLDTARLPPKDGRPSYVRVKGVAALDAVGRAVLRRLVEEREHIAASVDVPPFKILGSETLLMLARTRPRVESALRAVRGLGSGYAARHVPALLRAIEAGMRDGEIPSQDRVYFERPRIDRALAAARRARETQIAAWRREEAARRSVDEQAVLPGHCAQELCDAILATDAGDAELSRAIASIHGLGAARFERYAEAFITLARTPPTVSSTLASGAAAATEATVELEVSPVESEPVS